MFILSHSNQSIESKKVFNKSCKAYQFIGGDEIKSHLFGLIPKFRYFFDCKASLGEFEVRDGYSVIWSKVFISSKSKNLFSRIFTALQPKEGYEIESQNYAVIRSQLFISSQSKLSFDS